MDNDIIASPGLWNKSQAGLPDDAAKIDPAHTGQGLLSMNGFNFAWNSEAHGLIKVEILSDSPQLAQGKAAIVGGNTMLPENLMVFSLKLFHGRFKQVKVLKTPTGKRHPLQPSQTGQFRQQAGKRIVKPRANNAHIHSRAGIQQ